MDGYFPNKANCMFQDPWQPSTGCSHKKTGSGLTYSISTWLLCWCQGTIYWGKHRINVNSYTWNQFYYSWWCLCKKNFILCRARMKNTSSTIIYHILSSITRMSNWTFRGLWGLRSSHSGSLPLIFMTGLDFLLDVNWSYIYTCKKNTYIHIYALLLYTCYVYMCTYKHPACAHSHACAWECVCNFYPNLLHPPFLTGYACHFYVSLQC